MRRHYHTIPGPSLLCVDLGRLFLVSACTFVLGCDDGPQLVPVRGTVKYQDQTLEYGSVMFQPLAGGALARGQIQSDGSFVLTTRRDGDGVQIGKSRVRITAFEAQRRLREPEGAEEETPLGSSAIPSKYQNFGTSGIVVDVAPDMELPLILHLD